MFKIEKNVTLPHRPNAGFVVVPQKYPFGEMKIGDSFLIECENTKRELDNVRSSLFHHKKKFNTLNNCKIKITSRVLNNGIRVWKIK